MNRVGPPEYKEWYCFGHDFDRKGDQDSRWLNTIKAIEEEIDRRMSEQCQFSYIQACVYDAVR